MLHRQGTQQDGGVEVFEMASRLEAADDTRFGHERPDHTGIQDEKSGNEQDKKDMARLGHRQELKVSSRL